MEPSRIMNILMDWNFWGNYETQLMDRPRYSERMNDLFSRKVGLFILGIRRSGKSSLAELFLKERINKDEIEKKDILYINCEDPRFPPKMGSGDLMKIYETYLTELDPSDHIIVLDEVQDVDGWERFCRYLLESKKQRVIVTGSSSKVLDDEVSEILTGRHINIEIFPLSFSELLGFRGVDHGGLDLVKNRIEIKKNFKEYCIWGGFPEVMLSMSEKLRKNLLIQYFQDILIKDVVKRHNISDIDKLEMLAHLYITGICDIQSFNKMRVKISSSLDTVERYSSFLQKGRLFFFLDKFDWSRWKQIDSRKKVYVCDPGFYTMKGFKFSENRGKVMENIVAVELLRRTNEDSELYYWRDYNDHEIDFVVKEKELIKELIQVSSVSNIEDLNHREVRSLLSGNKDTGCTNLTVITDELEIVKDFKGVDIRFIPLWKWLLQ